MNGMSVLTAAEDAGLTEMAAGIQCPYETVGQSSPTLMYVLFLHWRECGGPDVLHVARPSDAAGCPALHPSLQLGLHHRHPPHALRLPFEAVHLHLRVGCG